MPTINETELTQATPLQASLDAGIDIISNYQTIIFTQYDMLILPADKFIFWVKSDKTMDIKGSFHFSGRQDQNEDETLGISHCIFTSEAEINAFTDIAPKTMWIGEFNGIKFAFNNKKNFYQQASLWHYAGDAIYAAMESQFISDATGFDEITPIVSNSLSIWLSLSSYFDMYPSFAIPSNITPPYASVHIEPSGTNAIQSVPLISFNSSHSQLVSDDVKITIYGERNTSALDFQDYVFDYMLKTDNMGLMDTPVIRDEKRIQSEYDIIAMKKTFSLKVSYYQTRANDIARQLILSAKVNYYPEV